MIRTLNFTAPRAGKTLISVNGTGYCENPDTSGVLVAEFDTQIVNNPSTIPSFKGPGGNKFKFTLPAEVAGITGNGVFNLSSQRLFSINAAGVQHYAFNLVGDRLDGGVICAIASAALTVLFLP